MNCCDANGNCQRGHGCPIGLDPMYPPAQDMPVVTPENAIGLCGQVVIALFIFAITACAAGYFLG